MSSGWARERPQHGGADGFIGPLDLTLRSSGESPHCRRSIRRGMEIFIRRSGCGGRKRAERDRLRILSAPTTRLSWGAHQGRPGPNRKGGQAQGDRQGRHRADNVDMEAATEKGIVVMNSPRGNALAAAEHTLALMFALARNVALGDRSVKEGRWDKSLLIGVEVSRRPSG